MSFVFASKDGSGDIADSNGNVFSFKSVDEALSWAQKNGVSPDAFDIEDIGSDSVTAPKDSVQNKTPVSSPENSAIVASARESMPDLSSIGGSIVSAAKGLPRLAMETVNPNITAYQDTSANANGIGFIADPEYWKAAGRDVIRALPFITAPIGGETVAAMTPAMRALYSAGRGAAESGLYANAENALGGTQSSPVDAMILGGALGGGMQAAGDVAASAMPALYRSALDVMARRGGVSPGALEAYSTPEGRRAVAQAFGSEKGIAKDMLRAAGPDFMGRMPEAKQLNKLYDEMPGEIPLGFLSKDFQYNPSAASGGGGLFAGEKAAAHEINAMQEPFLKQGSSASDIYSRQVGENNAPFYGPVDPYRTANPAQLNSLRKRLGADLDKSWNALQAGLPPDAEKTGQQVYRSIRTRLLDEAEKNGNLETAKQLLADQAKMLGARDEFIASWAGGAKTGQKAALNIQSTIGGVLNNPSIRKLDQMEKLVQFDREMGTDFADRVINASNARQMSSNTATPGNFAASMSPKTATGLGGTNPIFAAMNIASGASPAVGARYAGNLRSAADMSQVAKRGVPASAGMPILRAEILGVGGSQQIPVQEVTKQWSSIEEMDKDRKRKK